MDYWMVRTFDHAGYFETRLILSLLALGYALWRARGGGDRRFAIAWIVGVVAHASVEGSLAALAARGSGYSIAVFGISVSGFAATAVQGIVEGGPLMMMAWWFATMLRDRRTMVHEGRHFLAALVVVVVLASVTALIAHDMPITSARKILSGPILVTTLAVIVVSLLLVGIVRRGDGLLQLLLFAFGVLAYAIINFEPMHLGGVRYIGIESGGVKTAAAMPAQIWVMALSHIIEVAAGKLHYFAIPLAFGWLTLNPNAGECV
jgi:hypothetical protein